MKNYIRKCPTCGGEVIEREVTEVLSGERLYMPDTIKKFEDIARNI